MYFHLVKYLYCVTISLVIINFHFSAIASVPVSPDPIILKQPSGFEFTAYAKGNVYINWLETESNHTIIKKNNTWYYATKNKQGQLSASKFQVGRINKSELNLLPKNIKPDSALKKLNQKKNNQTSGKLTNSEALQEEILELPYQFNKNINNLNLFSSSNVPLSSVSSVDQDVLVILVAFADTSFTHSVTSFESLMFGATASVKDYFLENSYSNFTLIKAVETDNSNSGAINDGIISVTLGSNHPNSGSDFDAIDSSLVAAVTAANTAIDFSSYDDDLDGAISAKELSIVLIYAGYENSFGGASALTPRIWGHKSSMPTTTLDSVDIAPYTAFGEQHATSVPAARQATIGIMAHELGHLMLGLPDLYDVNGGSEGIGDWGLMGGGSWNSVTNSGDSPAHLTGWSKSQSGLIEPTNVTASLTADTLLQIDISSDYLRIWLDKYQIGEHFFLENRQQSNFDSGLSGEGLLITHIDPSNTTNSDENNKLVDVEEADGFLHLDNETNQGDTGDLFPGITNNTSFGDATNPNSDLADSTSSGVTVSSITENGANILVDVVPGNVGSGSNIRYDLGGVSGFGVGYGSTVIWTAVRFTNDTSNLEIEGFEVTLSDTAVVDAYFYDSIPGGTPTTLLDSELSFAGVSGTNRYILTDSISLAASDDIVLVLKITNSSNTFPARFDNSVTGTRSWTDSNGTGSFTLFSSGELNQHLLMGTDTNGDGVSDAQDDDDDGDGITDVFEIANGLDPLDDTDATIDTDADGLSNLAEFIAGTDPNDNDSDNDGVLDGADSDPLDINVGAILNNLNDFNGDGDDDILWRNLDTGGNELWLMDGSTRDSVASLPTISDPEWYIAGSGDFNADGSPDILFHHDSNGQVMLWLMNGSVRSSTTSLTTMTNINWKVAGLGDFNGDNKVDIFWRNKSNGQNLVWIMDGTTRNSVIGQVTLSDVKWKLRGIGDSDNDGTDDILWRHSSNGKNTLWLMDNGSRSSSHSLVTISDLDENIIHLEDMDLDGKADIVWRNMATGSNKFWKMNGATRDAIINLPTYSGQEKKPALIADYDGDGDSDFVWRDKFTGENIVWMMSGQSASSSTNITTKTDSWRVVNDGYRSSAFIVDSDFNKDQAADVLWRNNNNGQNQLWLMSGATRDSANSLVTLADTDWTVGGVGDFDGDDKSDILWHHKTNGKVSLWLMNGATRLSTTSLTTMTDINYGVAGVGDFNGDGNNDVFWRNESDGKNIVWLMNGTVRSSVVAQVRLSDTDWQVVGINDSDGDGTDDVLWRHMGSGKNTLWLMSGGSRNSTTSLVTISDLNEKIVGFYDMNKDGNSDIVWRNPTNGKNTIWRMDGGTRVAVTGIPSEHDSDWGVVQVLDLNGDSVGDFVWRNSVNGNNRVWIMTASGSRVQTNISTRVTDWQVVH